MFVVSLVNFLDIVTFVPSYFANFSRFVFVLFCFWWLWGGGGDCLITSHILYFTQTSVITWHKNKAFSTLVLQSECSCIELVCVDLCPFLYLKRICTFTEWFKINFLRVTFVTSGTIYWTNLKIFTNCDILGGFGENGIKIDVQILKWESFLDK